jgi:hypothetical protein
MSIRNKSTLLILIDPFQGKKKAEEEESTTTNTYSLKTLEYIKEPSNYIDYLFVSVYDCSSFLKNEKWCGKTSKRVSLENRVFTKKVTQYNPSTVVDHRYCTSLDTRFDEFNHKNILTTSAFLAKDLKDFLDTFSNIKNVMIAGEAWEKCVRFRPLGIGFVLKALKDYPKVNLLIDTTLIGGVTGSDGVVLNEDGDRIIGEPSWEKIGDSIFYLPKNTYDSYLEKEIHYFEDKQDSKRTKVINVDMDFKNERTLEKEKVDQQINLTLNDCISAKHLKLNLNDKISNSEIFE